MSDPQTTSPSSEHDSGQDALIGRQIGQYEIVEELGRGGMATVYLARQLNMTRQVAIKVLPREFLHDPQFIERFRREVQLIAELEHPHILPVYDFGEHDNIPYIVMRYLGGGSLLDILIDGLPDLADLERPMTQVCQALDYAHAEGIIHRDLKPSNILLDERGNAYLADFGIAQILQDAGRLTGSAVIGTPAYMAPEQAEGRPLDARADVYALGVVLFELLTGRGPYQADTPMALLLKQITEPMPSPRMFRPELPISVESVVLRATLKDPAGRYPSAAALGEAFSAALRSAAAPGDGLAADPPTEVFAAAPSSTAAGWAERDITDDDLPTMLEHEAGIGDDLPTTAEQPAQATPDPTPPLTDHSAETGSPAAPQAADAVAPVTRSVGGRRGLWIGLAVVAALLIIGIGVLTSGVLNPPPVPTAGPPTPFANANTYRGPENVYQVAMPNDWLRRDVSASGELAVLWHANDNSAYTVLRLLPDDDAVDAAAFARQVDAFAARYDDDRFFTLIDEAEQPDESLRVSYRVAQPDALYEQFGRGQLDVFYQQVGPYFTMIEMFTSDDADLENLLPVMQHVLAAVVVDEASEWDLD